MRRRRSLALALLALLLLVGGGALSVALKGSGAPPTSGAEPASTVATPGTRDRSKRRRAARSPATGPERGSERAAGGEHSQPQAAKAPEVASPETGAAPREQPSGVQPPPRANEGVSIVTAGRVVDAATDAPIAGARVRYAVVEGNIPTNWWGGTTAADGSFEVRSEDSGERAELARELIVDAPGYRVGRTGSPGEDVVILLERRTEPELPGTIAGSVTTPEGMPIAGPVQISGTGEYGEWAVQWVLADEGGRFRMEGVPPRYWRLWAGVLADRERARTVLVPSGGEASLGLVAAGAWADPTGGAGERREVEVSGLPEEARDGATLTAEFRPRLFWRTTTSDGRARLELPQGRWTLVLSWGIDEELRCPVDVRPGEAAIEVDMGAAGKAGGGAESGDDGADDERGE